MVGSCVVFCGLPSRWECSPFFEVFRCPAVPPLEEGCTIPGFLVNNRICDCPGTCADEDPVQNDFGQEYLINCDSALRKAVGVADFETFQKWIQCLFQMMRQPAPPGFRAPSVTQLLRADRQAFVKMQELTRDGIKPKGDGTRPLDQILEDMHKDHSVVYYMLPTVEPQKAAPKAKPDKPAQQTWGPWKGTESSSWRGPKQTQGKQKKGAGGQNGGSFQMGAGSALPTTLIAAARQHRVNPARRANMCAPRRDAMTSILTSHATRSDREGAPLRLMTVFRRNPKAFSARLVALSMHSRRKRPTGTLSHPLSRAWWRLAPQTYSRKPQRDRWPPRNLSQNKFHHLQ
eukprot:s1099_g19.t1